MLRQRDVKAVRLEKLRLLLDGIAERGIASIAATARSPLVKHILDCRTAVASLGGELCAVGRPGAVHMPTCLAAVRQQYEGSYRPGDIFVMNDPFNGGGHIPCVWLCRPVFEGGRHIAYVLASVHQVDFGGRAPGSMSSDSTEIYQEGLRLPPVRLYENDEPVTAIFKIIDLNVRVSDIVIGDIRGGVAALRTMERELLDLVARTGGADPFLEDLDELLNLGEAVSREALRNMPDGIGEWTEDVDCPGAPAGTIVHVKVTKRGDSLDVDFSGTSGQIPCALNNTWSLTRCHAQEITRIVSGADLPHNEGVVRPISIVAAEGSLMNPTPPSAVAARGIVSQISQYALLGAFSSLVPQSVAGCMVAVEMAVTFSGALPGGERYLHTEQLPGSGGGGPRADADDGSLGGLASGMSNVPIEIVENETPALRIEEYAFAPDTAGEGRYRGGLGVRRSFRALVDGVNVNVRGGRTNTPHYGLFGGGAGSAAKQRVVRANGQVSEVPSAASFSLAAGDLFVCESGGAGGYGPPAERDPAAIAADLRDGRLSAEYVAAKHPTYDISEEG